MSTQINVAFTAEDEQTIFACFVDPEDTKTYPFQAEISTSDPRYKVFYDSVGPVIQPYLPDPTTD